MLARELMKTPVVTLTQDHTLGEAARLLIEKRISGLPIVDESGILVGILTSTDFSPREVNVPHSDVRAIQLFRRYLGPGGMEAAYKESENVPLRDVMNTRPIVAGPDETLERIAQLMIENEINHVPIVEDSRIIGIITRHDFLRLSARA